MFHFSFISTYLLVVVVNSLICLGALFIRKYLIGTYDLFAHRLALFTNPVNSHLVFYRMDISLNNDWNISCLNFVWYYKLFAWKYLFAKMPLHSWKMRGLIWPYLFFRGKVMLHWMLLMNKLLVIM